MATYLHPTDELRLEVVGIRAELRTARQDLARKKRAVARAAKLHAKTAKEREQELELLVYADPDVIALENTILRLQHQEDLQVAYLENANRHIQQDQWFTRAKLADGLMELAASVAQSPVAHLSLAAAASAGERSAYLGDSNYIHERELE